MSYKTGRIYAKILGIRLDSTSESKVLRFVKVQISEAKKFYIVTPNPEIVLAAQSDKTLFEILDNASLSLADGVGLVAAIKFLELPTPKDPVRRFLALFAQGLGVGFSIVFDRKWLYGDFNLIRGREMFLELVSFANKNGWGVYLLGDRKQSAQKAAKKLKYNFKKVEIFASEGPNLDYEGNPISETDKKTEAKVIAEINKVSPELLFVGFGAPRQEKWVHKWLPKLDIGGAMVVGGTFDYISGAATLPPKWMAEAGLEWLWRLGKDPKRAKRIFKAFPEFAVRVFLSKIFLAKVGGSDPYQ